MGINTVFEGEVLEIGDGLESQNPGEDSEDDLFLFKTISVADLRRSHKNSVRDLEGSLKEEADWLDANRPRARADCENGIRPCPFLLCKHNLYLDVCENGALRINNLGLDPSEMDWSCALDCAEEGGITLEMVAGIMNVTRERARQIEAAALLKVREALEDPSRKLGGEYFAVPVSAPVLESKDEGESSPISDDDLSLDFDFGD